MRYLKLLLKKDIHQIKNYFLSFKNNKKRLFPVAFYILWFSFMINNNKNLDYSLFYQNNVALGLLSFLFFMTLINIYLERTSYFTMADVNLIFPSPIPAKIVLIYSIIRKSWSQLLAALFGFIFITPSILASGIAPYKLIIGILGYLLFILSLEPINFIISRKRKQQNINIIIVGIVLLYILLIGGLIVKEGSFKAGLMSTALHYIPLIGWAKGIYMSMFTGINLLTHIYTLLMLTFILELNIYILKTSDDFYEDVIVTTQNFEAFKNNAKKGKQKLTLTLNINKDKKNPFKSNHYGAKAFHWKNKLMSLRSDLHHFISYKTFIFIFLTIGITLFKILSNFDMPLLGMYSVVTGFSIYIYALFTIRSGDSEDLEMPLFYLIPENNLVKFLRLNQLKVQQMLINTCIFFSIPIILDYKNTFYYMMLLLIFNSIYWIILFSNLIVKSLFRSEADQTLMLPIIKLFQLLIIILPTLIGGGASAFYIFNSQMTENFSFIVVCIAIIVANIFTSLFLLLIADQIINRIEL